MGTSGNGSRVEATESAASATDVIEGACRVCVSVVVPLGSGGITGTISAAAAEGAVSHSITADDPSMAARRGRRRTLRRCPWSLAMLHPHCGNGALGYNR
ncbi:hypothetical protein StoSoilB5_04720 [Arthrobacter sp. StoSoilB5]|nr:hypothetical protein StoSoilB5_04720 [Arthrobacter sp. StoSoilB5]